MLALVAAAAAAGVNQKHTKHDKYLFKMRHHVNHTIAILSSYEQILWETRKVRLTEKMVGSKFAKSTCSCSS